MDIVEELRRNRECGARRLEAEYKAGLMALARRFFGNESDAEEVVNGTFANVVEHIDDYVERSAFFGWMCQLLMSEFSHRTRRRSNSLEILRGDWTDVADPDAQDAVFRGIDHSLVRSAIEELPESDREVLLLRYFMDIPVVKMARILRQPVGTVHSRLHYARKALAAKLGIAAKKPGGKAVVLALLLVGLTALGAGLAAAVRGGGETPSAVAASESSQPSQPSESSQPSEPSRPFGLTGRTGDSFPGEQNMNLSLTTRTTAAFASALAIQTAIPATSATAGSVWQDALLWFNGPVDANNDGKWTGNVSESGVPRKCDGTGGDTCEMPDARHGALASSNTQKLNYSTGAATVYQQSGFQIRTNDVHFTAWGNKTAAWPCLYLPQTTNGNTCYAHRWQMFDGAKLISGNQWTVLFRCRIDDYLLEGNPAWVWNAMTDTSKAAGQKEIRIGFGRNPNNTSDTKNYVKICLGTTQPAFTDLCVETNEWLEVAVVVDGRAEAHSIRASLARPNDVRWYSDYTVPYNHANYTTNFYLGNVWLGGPRSGAITSNKDNFRGDIQMFAIWNRCLSDREVCEAFGGGAPNLPSLPL